MPLRIINLSNTIQKIRFEQKNYVNCKEKFIFGEVSYFHSIIVQYHFNEAS